VGDVKCRRSCRQAACSASAPPQRPPSGSWVGRGPLRCPREASERGVRAESFARAGGCRRSSASDAGGTVRWSRQDRVDAPQCPSSGGPDSSNSPENGSGPELDERPLIAGRDDPKPAFRWCRNSLTRTREPARGNGGRTTEPRGFVLLFGGVLHVDCGLPAREGNQESRAAAPRSASRGTFPDGRRRRSTRRSARRALGFRHVFKEENCSASIRSSVASAKDCSSRLREALRALFRKF
jgi:hypothetical protein